MTDRYELIGQTPVPVEDLLEWACKFETMDRRVAHTTLFDMCRVSTVFLGLDYSFFDGPPLLFESMVFWGGAGWYEQQRCSTWAQAEEQHARMCTEVARPRAVIGYIARCFRNWREEAGQDLGRRWREVCGIEPTEMEERQW